VNKKILLMVANRRCTHDQYGSSSYLVMTGVEMELSTLLKPIIGPHVSGKQLVNSYILIAPNQRRDESGHSASEKTNI
jgi:hypothetical protein